MRHAIRDVEQLGHALELPLVLLQARVDPQAEFGLFVPWEFVARMRKGDPDDPLLRQVLPLRVEGQSQPHFTRDPVGDRAAQQTPGLLKKYAGRALLILTGACAVHCRYCFRRHFPYSEAPRGLAAWQPALDQIAGDPSIEEVLLSGGDPLTLVDDWLAELVRQLADIPHVQRLRVHTRLPIMIPQRITDALLGWLSGTRLMPLMVIHANHPAELEDDGVRQALARLHVAGVPLLNQAVLLRGVNDRADVLQALSLALLQQRVFPYYLHQLDQVAGAGHFEVPLAEGRRLLRELRARLPGYAVPRYVREVAGEPYKVPLE